MADIPRRRILQALAVLAGAGAAFAYSDGDDGGASLPGAGGGGGDGLLGDDAAAVDEVSPDFFVADGRAELEPYSGGLTVVRGGDRPGIVYGVRSDTPWDPSAMDWHAAVDRSELSDADDALTIVIGDRPGIVYGAKTDTTIDPTTWKTSSYDYKSGDIDDTPALVLVDGDASGIQLKQ